MERYDEDGNDEDGDDDDDETGYGTDGPDWR